jgi:hypothetical protein
MKTTQVRCWRTGPGNELLITYPEGEMGHYLICCLCCGKVYAVNVAKQLYIEPDLDTHLSGKACVDCGSNFYKNWSYYPDRYIGADGMRHTFTRSLSMPPEDESIITELLEVFS